MKSFKFRKLSIVFFVLIVVVAVIWLFVVYLSPIDRVLTHYARKDYAWQCGDVKTTSLTQSGSVKWLNVSCHGMYPRYFPLQKRTSTGPLKINLIDANLSDRSIALMPVVAKNINPQEPYTESLLKMVKGRPNLLAGINGGYFFKNRKGHSDQNCLGKHYPQLTTQGVGDGLLMIDHKTYSLNCSVGYLAKGRRSSIYELDNGVWHMGEAEQSASVMKNALGAGPGLVETVKGMPAIHMRWQGVLSTFEFSANSAVVIGRDAKGQQHAVFFTVDGIDKKKGMSAIEMANFIYHMLPQLLHIKIVSAMSMDQGGSTTMYVRDAKPPIVSHAYKHGGVREVYDALFITKVK